MTPVRELVAEARTWLSRWKYEPAEPAKYACDLIRRLADALEEQVGVLARFDERSGQRDHWSQAVGQQVRKLLARVADLEEQQEAEIPRIAWQTLQAERDTTRQQLAAAQEQCRLHEVTIDRLSGAIGELQRNTQAAQETDRCAVALLANQQGKKE